jgi:hypothetical protein
MNQPAEGIPIPQRIDPAKMDSKAIWDQLLEERRGYERRIQEERVKAKADLDRLRATVGQHANALEVENRTLMKSLTRLQQENDRLTQELTILRLRLEANGRTPVSEELPASMPPASIQAAPTARLQAAAEPALGAVPIVAPAPPVLAGEPVPRPPAKA